MLRFVPRYTHVPLAVGSVVLLLVTIGWLLALRGDGVWSPAVRLATPTPPVVAIPPSVGSPAPAAASRPSPRTADPAERYALESGPFATTEAADRFEDQVNRLGHATIRFRKQDVTRLYVVAATGFASTAEAQAATRQLGRGTVVETTGAAEVLLDRLPSLGDAIAASRPLRAQGFEVQVREAVSPAPIYYVRFGRFPRRADAGALAREAAREGVRSRVTRVR